MFCDILWSDPIESEDGKVANKFQFNHNRNCSYIFGVEATSKFLNNNKLMSLIRAHEVQYEGYRMYNWKGNGPREKERKFPQVITIFSAPKYTDSYNNKGAIIKFEVMINRKMLLIFSNLSTRIILIIYLISWMCFHGVCLSLPRR
jgi:serine/threonine-protein phosphatase 2B catalytic subunit